MRAIIIEEDRFTDFTDVMKLKELDKRQDSIAERKQSPWDSTGRCWCETCRPVTIADCRMVVCPTCGSKRCPHANDHRNACTGSNESGQPGSAYPTVCHGITGTAPQGVEPSVEAVSDAVQAAVLAERERCALVCDHLTWAIDNGGNPYRRESSASQCAAEIRKGPQ